jgi:hypothetical protein
VLGVTPDAAQEEVLEAADESVAVAEGQRVADDGPEDGDQAHHGEALHHGAEDVLFADQAAVEESQAGTGHQQDQGRGDQHPGVVAGGLGAGAGSLSTLDGLLEGGDLGLRGWSRGIRAQAGATARAMAGSPRTADKEQQFDCTTTHRFLLLSQPAGGSCWLNSQVILPKKF